MWNIIPWKKNESSVGTLTADPFDREFSRIRDDFDHLLQRMWSGSPFGDLSFDKHWGLDLDETESHYVAHIEAPGFEVGDFEVSISGDKLIVKAERKDSKNGKNGSSYRYGKLQKVLSLPDSDFEGEVEANYRSGILEVKIPKSKESQNVKRITVKAA